MTDKEQDPNLQAPQEANTTKHINFVKAEEDAAGKVANDTAGDNDDDNPTKKAWEELRKDEASKDQ